MSISNLLVENDLDVYIDTANLIHTSSYISATGSPGGLVTSYNRNAPLATDGTLTAGQVINSILASTPSGSSVTLTLPNVADVLAILPDGAKYVGAQFTMLLRVDGVSKTLSLAASANGSFTLANSAAISIATGAGGGSTSRLCYCLITSISGDGAMVVY